jgi:hypothetical protein
MKPPFQHQQQQRMQRERMMGAAWQEKQKAKKFKKEQAQKPQFTAASKFNQVAAEVEKLKKSLSAGKLTQKQFEDRLASLMFQDENGTWWMVGAETGGWYYYDGSNWLAGAPLGVQSVTGGKSKGVSRGAKTSSFMDRLSAFFNAIFTFVIGMAVTIGLGLVAGDFVAEFENDTLPFIVLGVIWLGGFILVSRETQKRWRGE